MILAADPGLEGALAVYDANAKPPLQVVAMPTLLKGRVAKSAKRVIDEHEVLRLFQTWALLGVEVFYLEQVGGRRGQGADAAFSFGQGFGSLRMAALASGMRIETVSPAVWKGAMRAPKDKTASRHRASELFPGSATLWPLKKDDGKAESAMLALYGARMEAKNAPR